MPDLPDTVADSYDWKPLPVPTGAVNAICQGADVRVTFKADPSQETGFVLAVGKAIRLKAGDAGHIKPAESFGGRIVLEDFG